MRDRPVGSIIGIIAGLVFVLVNAPLVDAPWSVVLIVIGVLGAVLAGREVVRARGVVFAQPSRRAMRIYLACVVGEIVAIPVGAVIINQGLDRPELTVLWVILVVGVHFLPFATAFGVPLFARLAWTLIVLALLGVVLTVATADVAASVVAVLAGYVLLGFSAVGARQSAHPR